MPLEDKLRPVSFLPSLKGYISSALEIQAQNVELLRNGQARSGGLYDMRKASVKYLEASHAYQAQLNTWKSDMMAYYHKDAIEALEEDLSKLRKLSQFILQNSSGLLRN